MPVKDAFVIASNGSFVGECTQSRICAKSVLKSMILDNIMA